MKLAKVISINSYHILYDKYQKVYHIIIRGVVKTRKEKR